MLFRHACKGSVIARLASSWAQGGIWNPPCARLFQEPFLSSRSRKRRVQPPSVREMFLRDGSFSIGRYSPCVRRWEVVARVSLSWGTASLSFDLNDLQGDSTMSHLKVYSRLSKKVWRHWLIGQVPLSVNDLAIWEDRLMFELRKRMADGSLPPAKDDFIDPYFAKRAPAVGQTLFQSAFPD